MRINIVLDDELIAEAFRVTGIKATEDLIHEALRVLIATRKRKNLLDLKGRIEFTAGYDYKALREERP